MKMKNLLGIGLLAFALALTGCSSSSQEKLKEDVSAAEQEATKFVEEAEEITKEDIKNATDYIEANIEKVKDGEIAQNLVKAGAFLENAAKKGVEAVDHELVKLGKETKEYATNVYTAVDEEKDKLLEEGKETFKSWGDTLSKEKDKLVEDFHKLLNK